MTSDRLFLDTAFIQALLNRRDKYHEKAKLLFPRVREAREIWVTQAVLLEVGNALRSLNRAGAETFIRQCYNTSNVRVVEADHALIMRSLDFHRSHEDKDWSLTDCLSFIVMRDEKITEAATADLHFRQAGFRALLLEE